MDLASNSCKVKKIIWTIVYPSCLFHDETIKDEDEDDEDKRTNLLWLGHA